MQAFFDALCFSRARSPVDKAVTPSKTLVKLAYIRPADHDLQPGAS